MTGGTADVAQISPARRRQIVDALRRGTVPQRGLDVLAVGIGHLAPTFNSELGVVASGGAGFKAIRGEYGAGKTFVTRWLAERARQRGFATAEVQISEGETPLHHLETVYRRAVERLVTPDQPTAALRSVIDGWFFALEEEVLAGGQVDERDEAGLLTATDALAERRLADVATRAPAFGAVLRTYRRDDRVLRRADGMHRLAPLAQRLATDFTDDPRFDNPRAPQLRLGGFDEERLVELGARVRDVYGGSADHADRVDHRVDRDYGALLARALTGELGGKVGVVPRVFAKKLVDVLDKVDLHADFDPRQHYQLTVAESELTEVECSARAASGVDDIELSLRASRTSRWSIGKATSTRCLPTTSSTLSGGRRCGRCSSTPSVRSRPETMRC